MGFWDTFGDTSYFIPVEDQRTESVASDVIEQYGYNCKTRGIGGALNGFDIKHMDALQVVKMSLLEGSAIDSNQHGPYEAFVDYDTDSIEFKEIGSYSANIGWDIYQQVQTGTYIEDCNGVIVHGRDPLPERQEPIWKSLVDTEVEDEGYRRIIYDCSEMMGNCNKDNMNTYCIIIYDDPHLTDNSYADGIDNFYNIDSPFEHILGYAKRKYAPGLPPEATLTDARQTTVPINVGTSLGILQRPLSIPLEATEDSVPAWCWTTLAKEGAAVYGVPINLPDSLRYVALYGDNVDKFMGVSAIYIVGKEMTSLQGRPRSAADMVKKQRGEEVEPREIWASIDMTENKVFKLQEGVEYVIAYIEDDNTPHIVFSNQSHQDDDAVYGDDVTYTLNPQCRAAINLPWAEIKNRTGTILPTSNYNGLLVEEVWAMVDLESPCTVVKDPHGNARQIAELLTYELAALVVEDLPPPIAFAGKSSPDGRIIDQASSTPDHDPTTKQDLRNTDFENALTEMDGGGGLTLNMSFMEEEECRKLATMLYRYMNTQDGVEIVYTCGPDANPELGGYTVGGGIVNSIVHEYTDSGSYTVSVTESGRLVSDSTLGGVTGGPAMGKMENAPARGTVVEDMGNHVFFKVRLDGFGTRLGVNMSSSILRSGDKVVCTIHNNPVGE